MKLLLATAILSSLVVIVFGAPYDDNGRIINGEAAGEGEFPYFASVYLNGNHICGGFIYNQEYIVTAASCVDEYESAPRELSIVVGQINLIAAEQGEQMIMVRQVIVHPSYNMSTGWNDIALLHAQQPIQFSDKVYYIRYDEEDFLSSSGIVMGFGTVIEGGLPFSRLLKTIVQTREDCTAINPNFYVSSMMCAGSRSSAVCDFDQGSPLVQNNVAKGIVSRFNKNCTGPAVYTRLTPYYGFFQDNAGFQPTPTTLPVQSPTSQQTASDSSSSMQTRTRSPLISF